MFLFVHKNISSVGFLSLQHENRNRKIVYFGFELLPDTFYKFDPKMCSDFDFQL